MPEYSTAEERQLLRLEQQQATIRIRALARKAGKGPLVTEKMVEAELLRVRDAAHDRVHLRRLQEQGQPVDEVAVPIPSRSRENR